MTIRVTRLPEYGVNVSVYSGTITPAELVDHYCAIDAEDAACADRWISYFGPTADLSQVDLAAMAQLRRLTGAKLAQVYGDRTLKVAIVCKARDCQPVLGVWRNYIASDPTHRSEPGLFPSLTEACEWLDLPAGAALALASVVGEIRVDAPRVAARTIGRG